MHGLSDKVSGKKKKKQTKVEETTTNQPTNKQTNKQTSSPPQQQHHPQLVLGHQEIQCRGKEKTQSELPWLGSK
jgi:hypothetical protein